MPSAHYTADIYTRANNRPGAIYRQQLAPSIKPIHQTRAQPKQKKKIIHPHIEQTRERAGERSSTGRSLAAAL